MTEVEEERSILSAEDEDDDDEDEEHDVQRNDAESSTNALSNVKVYKRRWYILLLFSLLGIYQASLPNPNTIRHTEHICITVLPA